MRKNILIISSSPCKGGNSDTLCDQFMKGAEEVSNRVNKIRLEELTIQTISELQPGATVISDGLSIS